MAAYNARSRAKEDRRMLSYYATIDPSSMTPFAQAPNLHACAHLYASDRNSLFLSAAMQDVEDWRAMASLSHTVVFHTTDDALDMTTTAGSEKWILQEASTDRLEDDRITHHSRIWDDKGKHIATTFQDGMLKLPKDGGSRL